MQNLFKKNNNIMTTKITDNVDDKLKEFQTTLTKTIE